MPPPRGRYARLPIPHVGYRRRRKSGRGPSPAGGHAGRSTCKRAVYPAQLSDVSRQRSKELPLTMMNAWPGDAFNGICTMAVKPPSRCTGTAPSGSSAPRPTCPNVSVYVFPGGYLVPHTNGVLDTVSVRPACTRVVLRRSGDGRQPVSLAVVRDPQPTASELASNVETTIRGARHGPARARRRGLTAAGLPSRAARSAARRYLNSYDSRRRPPEGVFHAGPAVHHDTYTVPARSQPAAKQQEFRFHPTVTLSAESAGCISVATDSVCDATIVDLLVVSLDDLAARLSCP